MIAHQYLSIDYVTSSHNFGKQGPQGTEKAWRRSDGEYEVAEWDMRSKGRVSTNKQTMALQKVTEVPSYIMSDVNLIDWSVKNPELELHPLKQPSTTTRVFQLPVCTPESHKPKM